MTDTSITTSGTLTFCNLPCKAGGEYNVDHHNSMVFSFFCEDKSLRVYGGYKNRTTVDTACGCVIVTDISSHDDGTYFIYHFKEESNSLLHMVDCHYMAPIIISNISITRLGENSSLTVHYTGDEPATVIWSKKGGDLPDGHRLTDHNKTLTIPGNVTGVYRVVVYNSASTDSREYGTSEGDPSDAGIICAIVFPLLLIIVLIVIWVMIRRKKYTGGAKIQYNPAPLQR
ncbi:uncharacterized protein [Engystomops pustulosus]|uniref:uncharacterized protein n=1 Tax=Engystomops pustulosus TaxID=76066 RepID=UPI003AFA938B